MNISSNKQYFKALTGIRAIAAYLVFWFHFNPFHKGNFAWKLTNETHIGVGIFFVLSGFLITTRYSNHVTLTRAWWQRYMQNRVARIYPLYAIITGLTFTAYAIAPSLDLTGQWLAYRGYDKLIVIGLNLSFLRGFFEKFVFTGIAQGWTLSVEECFYLFAPLAMWLLYKVRMRYLLLVAGAVALMLLGAAIVTITRHPFGFFSSYKFMFLFTLPGRVAEFAIGMALAYSTLLF
ncbi:acyltransferase family protein [Hymenobacter rubripertinctus]|uniref:Acyltransferase n=1 Tax=Hymenobacter rubripertinctus TaxID=2029981 RepID=A0A418QWD1_9BACT|nr:acyltransferase [Hymenobacter rubripertinctus]RIY09509.1 acyltransferase [Hymenobacter rubripertinctus]